MHAEFSVCSDACNVSRSVQFSHSVMSNSLWPHGLQHTRPPCPSPTPGVYSNSCPLSRWCHPTISSSVFPFSSCLQSFPASGSFPMSQFFASMWEIRWQKGFPDGTEFRVGGLCLQRMRVRRRVRTPGTLGLSPSLVMCVPAKPAHLITGQEGRFQVF